MIFLIGHISTHRKESKYIALINTSEDFIKAAAAHPKVAPFETCHANGPFFFLLEISRVVSKDGTTRSVRCACAHNDILRRLFEREKKDDGEKKSTFFQSSKTGCKLFFIIHFIGASVTRKTCNILLIILRFTMLCAVGCAHGFFSFFDSILKKAKKKKRKKKQRISLSQSFIAL